MAFYTAFRVSTLPSSQEFLVSVAGKPDADFSNMQTSAQLSAGSTQPRVIVLLHCLVSEELQARRAISISMSLNTSHQAPGTQSAGLASKGYQHLSPEEQGHS